MMARIDEKQRLKVLITVKTYPLPSSKYDELVCTAGVTETGDFVRLYPINFRDLPFSQQFKKYQWIEVIATKHKGRDQRKESYRPVSDSIQILSEPISSSRGDWSKRAQFALKNKAQSMEDLWFRQKTDRTSLGVFEPKKVRDLVISDDDPEWRPEQLKALLQARLWETRSVSKEPPRKVPFKFHYHFDCDDEQCNGHEMSIYDWEAGVLFWKLVDNGDSHKVAAEKVRSKFLDEICGADKDTYFFVGTNLKYSTWMVLGLFYPKIPMTETLPLPF